MEAERESEYWMPELVEDYDDWVSRFVQGRGASLDLEYMAADENEDGAADVDMTTDEGHLRMEPKIHDISKQFLSSKTTPSTEVSHIRPPTSSLRTEHVQPSLTQQGRPRIPFSKRWEILKPEIERLYVDENIHLCGIIKIMRERYDFDAM